MDPRDRADQALARARSRRAYIVTPETAESPMDAQSTVQIPRRMVQSAEQSGRRDPNSTVLIDQRPQQHQPFPGQIPGQPGDRPGMHPGGPHGPGQHGSGHPGTGQAQQGGPMPGFGTPPGGQQMPFGGPPPISPAPGNPQLNPAQVGPPVAAGPGGMTQYVAAPQFTAEHGQGQQTPDQFGAVSHLAPGQHFGPGQPDQPMLPPPRPQR